mmetsp:Transcript_5926/g.14183  ORF Transcript_5926/g.14183 Transcript_5926/m.14183 type:complete len:217 (-) Transcript_5926:1927-2577(-)
MTWWTTTNPGRTPEPAEAAAVRSASRPRPPGATCSASCARGRGRSPRRRWPTAGLMGITAIRVAPTRRILPMPMDGNDRPPRRPAEATMSKNGNAKANRPGSCPTILPPTTARRPTDTTIPLPTPFRPTFRPPRRRRRKPNWCQPSKKSRLPTWTRNLASSSPIATPCTRPPSARSEAERGRILTTSSITMGTRSPTSTGSPCRNSGPSSMSRTSP